MGVTAHYQLNTSVCGTKNRPPDQPCQQMFQEAENAVRSVLDPTGIPYQITWYDQRDIPKDDKEPFYGIIITMDPDNKKRLVDLAYGWDLASRRVRRLPRPTGRDKYLAPQTQGLVRQGLVQDRRGQKTGPSSTSQSSPSSRPGRSGSSYPG